MTKPRDESLLPSPEYLCERLRYDPGTGKLFWREHSDMPAHWNTRYAGKEAFTAIAEGYRKGSMCGRMHLAHRVIWAMVNSKWPAEQIDHIDHNRTNNRIANLREVDTAGNARNTPLHRKSKSGATGVYWNPAWSKWRVGIKVNGRDRHIGHFAEFEDAVAARREAERSLGFHPNHGRELVKEQDRG